MQLDKKLFLILPPISVNIAFLCSSLRNFVCPNLVFNVSRTAVLSIKELLSTSFPSSLLVMVLKFKV